MIWWASRIFLTLTLITTALLGAYVFGRDPKSTNSRLFGLIVDIHQLGYRRLHTKRHFVLLDARRDLWVTRGVQLLLIDFCQRIQDASTVFKRVPVGIGQEENRIAVGAKLNPLVFAWQETSRPQTRPRSAGRSA